MTGSEQNETPLARALRERKELQERIRADAQRLEKLEQIIAWLRNSPVEESSVEKGMMRESVPVPGIPTSQQAFVTLVRALLLEIGHPMESTEIIEKFEERGHPLGRSNVVKQTWNKLWFAKRDGDLTHIPKLGYWVPGEPLTEKAKLDAAEARAARIKRRKPHRKGGTARPWEGKPRGRRRQLTDEQLKMAEQSLLDGKSQLSVAKTLGVSTATIRYHFPAGREGIRQRRIQGWNELALKIAEGLKKVVEVIEESKRKYGTTLELSGDIEGMKYTVFQDGSMEVDLPNGKTRFASMKEFQRYLATR